MCETFGRAGRYAKETFGQALRLGQETLAEQIYYHMVLRGPPPPDPPPSQGGGREAIPSWPNNTHYHPRNPAFATGGNGNAAVVAQ